MKIEIQNEIITDVMCGVRSQIDTLTEGLKILEDQKGDWAEGVRKLYFERISLLEKLIETITEMVVGKM